jgi:hypothetical protein
MRSSAPLIADLMLSISASRGSKSLLVCVDPPVVVAASPPLPIKEHRVRLSRMLYGVASALATALKVS